MAQVDQITVLIRGEDQLSRPAAAAARSLQGMDKAAHGADQAVAAVGRTAQQQTGPLGAFAGALGKIGLAGLGIQAAFQGIKTVGGVLTGPIAAASDLAESVSKVDVVFGKSAPAIQDWAKTTAQSLGQSRAEALAAAGGFGNLFVSMGLGQQPAADLSKKIVTLGSDLASFNNIKPEEALEKLRAGLVGEAEPLRALGVNLNEAAVEEEALRLGLAKSKKEITDSAKIQARYSLILKQTKTAQGDFARTSTGLANSQRIIAASFADLQTQIGERLLPVIAPLVSSFAQWLPQAMDRVAPALDRMGQLFQGAASEVGRFVEAIRSGGVLSALQQLGERAVPVLLQGFQSVRDLAGRIATWLGEQVARIDWTGVWRRVVGVAQGLLAGLGSVVSTVTQWLVQQWQAINWATVWGAVKNAASGLVGSLGSVVSAVTTWLGQQWAAIKWPEVWASVKNAAAGLAAGLGSIVSFVVGWLGDQWGLIKWDAIWKQAVEVGEGLIDGLAAIADAVTTWVGTQWANIDWPAIWREVQGHGAALIANLATISTDLQAWLVTQVKGVDWPSVWREGGAGERAAQSFADLLDSQDATPTGEAVGRFIAKTIKFGVGIGMGLTGGGWDQASEVFSEAFKSSIVQAFVSLATFVPRTIGQYLMGYWKGGIKEFLGMKPEDSLAAALGDAIRKALGVGGNRGGESAAADVKPGASREGPTGPIGAYQHGGSFYVGGRGGPDSQYVAFRATPGERVDVTPPGGARGGASVVINLGGVSVHDQADEERLVGRMRDELEAYFSDGLRAARGSGVRYPLGLAPGAV